MTASRVRVRPPHSHSGLLLFTATLAMLMAIPVGGYGWMLWYGDSNWFWRFWQRFHYGIGIVHSIQVALAMLPFIGFLIWLPRQCQHVGWVWAAGATYGIALASFSMLWIDLCFPWAASYDVGPYLLILPVAALIGAALAYGALFIQRTFIMRLIEQDGTLCNHCGYPAARSGSATCPECGGAISPTASTRSERIVCAFGRRPGSVATLLVLLLVGGYALVAWAEREHRTLGNTFAGTWRQPAIHYGPFGSQTSAYRHVPYEGDSMIVAVALVRQPAWRPHLVRVHLMQGGDEEPLLRLRPGAALIYAEVPRSRSREVLRHGPPQKMIDRLVDAAREAEWQHGQRLVADKVIVVPWEE